MDKQTKTDKYAHHRKGLPSIHRRCHFITAGTGTGTGSLSTGTGTEGGATPPQLHVCLLKTQLYL